MTTYEIQLHDMKKMELKRNKQN